MKVFRTSDRIKVKIGDLMFVVSPLTYKQKIEIQTLMGSKKEIEGSILCVQYALKDVDGLEDIGGDPYKLEFDDDNKLTEDSVNDILNIEDSMKLQLVCANLINGIPSQILHPVTQQAIDGIEIVMPKKSQTAPKKKRKGA